MLSALLALQLLAATPQIAVAGAEPQTYDGRRNQTKVAMLRVDEGGTKVDGTLDEPVWSQAARLTGFTQFSPQDGVAAADSTEVLVWYSPTAIHFGIRAFESHGRAQATLADRDKIGSDDQIQLFLSTQGEARRAYVFGVNPLGVQMDGVLLESNQNRTGDFTAAQYSTREAPDLSPDFVFQSKGRLTEGGYEIEVRVPFKSIKYQEQDKQSWRINVLRRVQHAGEEDTWAPVKQASTSFLDQGGTLDGLTDLHRGLVLDVNPDATVRATTVPAPNAPLGTGYIRRPTSTNVGLTARWGITSQLTANATLRPDFSQVESDAAQLVSDPRNALFFPEKRPFFLDGIEQFDTPHTLVYTRSIVQPIAAGKLTGKIGATGIAFMTALDDRIASPTGADNPRVGVLRLTRVTSLARLGATVTDRTIGDAYNRVADVDAQWASGPFSALAQYAHGFTNDGRRSYNAPLWQASLSANTRSFGARYAIDSKAERFQSDVGFIGRPGISTSLADHRFTWFAAPTSFVQTVTFNPVVMETWQYTPFLHGADALEKKLHINLQSTLRGGWGIGTSLLTEVFSFDSTLYANYTVDRARTSFRDTVRFVGRARIPNQDWAFTLNTPQWRWGSAYLLNVWGRDENFFEWAASDINYAQVNVSVRPSERLRIDGSYIRQSYNRPSDRSTVSVARVPRVKVEYQLARPIFVRAIGQFVSQFVDSLRDEGGSGLPLLVNGQRTHASSTGRFRGEVLFSYQPTPGTVVFAGYGANYADTRAIADPFEFPRSLGLRGYRRGDDLLFVKASYLLRF